MELDELEKLFHQVEEEVAEADRQYDEWRKSMGLQDQTPPVPQQHTTPVPPPKDIKSASPHENEPMVDRADWQVYSLRRKFCKQRKDLRSGQAIDVMERWQERPAAEMSTGELYLLARKELATGKVTDKARSALLILSRRKDEEAVRRLFLYAYAISQQAMSTQGLEELVRQLPKSTYKNGADHCLLYAAYCITAYISNVTEYVQDMAEQGYRNRQQLLEQARQQAQQKLERAQLDLNRV